jgi:FAD/FMN-containing dehydrogenase
MAYTLPPRFLDALSNRIDPQSILLARDDLAPALVETRGLLQGEAGALLLPKSTAEISAVLGLAHEFQVPVVAQGGNTGLVGGGVPQGGIVLSLKRMQKIRKVDPLNAAMIVEAGVTLHAAQHAAHRVDRFFPLSLASEGSCTIGGNIATNAGGTAVLRYGNMRDLVLGLEVVLPDGRIWNGLTALRKDNAGYDLKHLFIGSEGTLGIVSAACLKLFPAIKQRATALIGARSPAAIVALFDRLRARSSEHLSTFELIPRFGLEIVLKHHADLRDPLPEIYSDYALVELSSNDPDANLSAQMEGVLQAALEAGEIENAVLAKNDTERASFWHLRENLSESQRYEGGSIKHDISVPITAIADFILKTSALCEAAMPGLRPCIFGHIGDGNLHFNLSQPIGMEKAAFLAHWSRFNRIVHDEVARRGGSIAAEHGVGLLKRDELPRYKDQVAMDLMRTLKRALDPTNLLNPGKVLQE